MTIRLDDATDRVRKAARAEEVREAHDRGDRRPAGRSRSRPGGGSPTRSRPRSGLSGGVVVLDFVDLPESDPNRERMYSEHLACLYDDLSFEELEPRSFSFNSPWGACPDCTGLGTRMEVDPELVVSDPDLSAGRRRDRVWSGGHVSDYFLRLIEALGDVPRVQRGHVVGEAAGRGPQGAAARLRASRCTSGTRTGTAGSARTTPTSRARSRTSSGGTPRRRATTSRERFAGYMREVPCPSCHGTRLKPLIAGGHDGRPVDRRRTARCRSASWPSCCCTLELSERDQQIAGRVLKEINARLGFLLDVGLDYLTLDRASATLAGGEAQRIRLATQIGSGLVGVLYVLDEPSIGLHQRDNHRLLETLLRLRDLGNTLIVVEHDEDTIRAADWVVDIGPRAGEHGGQIVVSGPLDGPAGQRGVADRRLPDRPGGDRGAGQAAQASRSGKRGRGQGRDRAQPARRRRGVPARLLHRGHRRLRARASRRWSTTSCTARWPRSCTARRIVPGKARQGHRHAAPGQGGARRPGADRPHAAVQPGHLHRRVRPHPPAVRADDRGQGPRLPAGPVLVQRQGRPVRGVRGRRHDQDRDAVPAGRVRAVRGLPRRPVQHRHAAGALQGQDDRRRAEHADRGGRRSSSSRSRRSTGT